MILEKSYEEILKEVTLARDGRNHYPFEDEFYELLAREKYEAGSSKRESNRRRASRKRTSNPEQDRYTRNQVWEKCGGLCYLCGLSMVRKWNPKNRKFCFTVDHIVPLAKGGADVFDNVNGAHMSCNLSKGCKEA